MIDFFLLPLISVLPTIEYPITTSLKLLNIVDMVKAQEKKLHHLHMVFIKNLQNIYASREGALPATGRLFLNK